MTLEVLYFAWVRERMGRGAETLTVPAGVDTVGALAAWLKARDPAGERAFGEPDLVRAAVNQDFATAGTTIRDGDEVAFFPPVTGG